MACIESRYCMQCKKTQPLRVEDSSYTCTRCGAVGKRVEVPPERDIVGDPGRAFRTKVTQ